MAIIYQTFNFADAKYRVHVTKNPFEADLWANTVNYLGGNSGDLIWYFTLNRDEATCRINLCSYGEAELIVFFVPSFTEAGWRTNKNRRYRFS